MVIFNPFHWVYRIIEIEWAVKNGKEFVPSPKPPRKTKNKNKKTKGSRLNENAMDVDGRNNCNNNNNENDAESAAAGASKFPSLLKTTMPVSSEFGMEVTNTPDASDSPSLNRSKRSYADVDDLAMLKGQMMMTPVKRQKRDVVEMLDS